MNLLEREAVVGAIEALVERAAEPGDGSVVLLAGEAGGGKTSVVREVERRAERSTLVMKGACDPLSTPRPLGPLRDVLASADHDDDLFELGLALDERGDPIAGYETLVAWFRRRTQPALLVIEDVHWADTATIDLIRFIARRAAGTGVVVVCTYRSDEIDRSLRVLLGELATVDAVHRLEVEPLSPAAVAELSGLEDGEASALHRLTAGNPFYVTEVLATETDLPPTVRDAVIARLARLDESSRSAVEVASIAPGRIEFDLLVELSGIEPDRIDRAVAAGVLEAEGATLRFRHELARVAVESSLPPARRLGLHRAMLERLASRRPADPARRAHHAIEGGDPVAIRREAAAAGRDAAKRGTHLQAVTLLERAIEASGSDPDQADERAELRLDLAQELHRLDVPERTAAVADEARRHFNAVGRTDLEMTALLRRAPPEWLSGRADAARHTLDEAVALAAQLDDPHAKATVHLQSATHHMLGRMRGPAQRDLELVGSLLERFPDDALAARLRLTTAAIEVATGDAGAGLAELAEIRDEARVDGRLVDLRAALDGLGSGAGERRRYAIAEPALAEAIALAESRDDDWFTVYCGAWQARVAYEQGRWEEVSAIVARLAQFDRGWSGASRLTGEGAVGGVRVRRGDPGGAELLAETIQRHRSHELQQVWPPTCGLAEHAWLTGRPDRIPDLLGDLYERALAADSEWARGECGFWMWRAGAIDRPPEGAAGPFRKHMDGDWRGAAEDWRVIGCPYEQAMALADGDAEARLAAVAILDGLGAGPAASMVRARLRDDGTGRVPRGPTTATKANPAGLTARQLEVLGLMTAGRTNGEIAEELFISKKTVEHHVSAVLSKLGATTRAKAIATARDMGVDPEI